MGQTVNLLLFSFGGSNPSAPTRRHQRGRTDCAMRNKAPRVSALKTKTFCEAFVLGKAADAEGEKDSSRVTQNCGNSSVDRALAFQAGGRGFESRFPLHC